VFAELRAMRERTEAIKAELRARRERALAEVAACDQALAELGSVGELAVAALAPTEPVTTAETPRARAIAGRPAAAAEAKPPESKGVRRGDPVAAELTALLPWIGAIDGRKRKSVEMRASGMSPQVIGDKLGITNKDVMNDVMRGRSALREARAKGKPGETPASDDEGEPAAVAAAFADLHPAAPRIARDLLNRRPPKEVKGPRVDWELLGADGVGYVAPANDGPTTAVIEPSPARNGDEVPVNDPTGWDRSDPDADFTDVPPPPEADAALVHLWSPESGGTPACTLRFQAGLQLVTGRADVTCQACFAIADAPQSPGADQRPPDWVLGWLAPEIRRAYEGVALEGLSFQTMAWTEDVTPNVISGRVNGARQKVKRLLRWEAERAAEGNPITDQDREPPPAYRNAPDPLLAILRQPEAPEPQLPDETPATPAVERVRAKLTVIDGRIRSKTISAARLSRSERVAGAELDYPADVQRPRTRGDCADMPRPCPFVSCSHHLYLEVNPESGALKLNFPHLEVDQLAETCSLDVADRGGITLEETGAILNITRERVRQLEVRGLDAMRDGHFENAPDRMGSPLSQAIGD